MLLVASIVASLLVGVWVVRKFGVPFILPPARFPKNIPTIPFYYALLPLFKPVDQEVLWHKYLKEPLTRHGAVKIYFGGSWNVLVTRPAYIDQVLKHHDAFPKAGNQVKNPHGLLAFYTGENIISTIGDTWKRFTSIIRPGLQADVDNQIIINNAQKLVGVLLREQYSNGRVVMPSPLQQYTLENLGQALLGVNFDCLGNPDAPMTSIQSQIKPKIFSAIYMNFPVLDRFKFARREDARRMVQKFKSLLVNYVLSSHQHKHDPAMESTHLGCRLVTAYETGLLSRYHFQQNCVSVFLAGHENPQILLLFLMYILAEHRDLQQQLRQAVLALAAEDQDNPSVLANIPLLTSTIYETLRLYPPINQLLNRRAKEDVMLGGDIMIRAGTNLGYSGYTTNRDKEFWGADSADFRPGRWGSTPDEVHALFRRATSKSAFISFHGGSRTCLGIKFAMLSTRIVMSIILRSVKWNLDPTWRRKMTPAGPLIPIGLRLQFTQVDGPCIEKE